MLASLRAAQILTGTKPQDVSKILKETAPILEGNVGFDSLKTYINNKNLLNKQIDVSKSIGKRFIEALKGPFEYLYNVIKGLFGGKKVREEIKEARSQKQRLNQLLGYWIKVKEHQKKNLSAKEIRKAVSDSDFSSTGSYIPGFSNDKAQLATKIVAGTVGSYFLANDYKYINLLASKDEKKAEAEKKKRFAMFMSCLGLDISFNNLLASTFKGISNKSLGFATGLAVLNSLNMNILGRKLFGIPVLPVKHKESHDNPFILHAANLLNDKSSYKGYTERREISFGSRWDVATMPANVFKENLTRLSKLDPENSKRIEKMVRYEDGEVVIGKSMAYRVAKGIISAITFPFRIVAKALGLIKKQENRFTSEQSIKNMFKWAREAEQKASVNLSAKELYGENFSKFQSPDVMSYGTDQLSSAVKLTGLVSVPFFAVDAYNIAMKESKSEKLAEEKARQRVVQDSVRQGLSLWFVNSFNNLFKGVMNSSLLGTTGTTIASTVSYETGTRAIVGQPILPGKSYEEIKEIEKKRLASDNWFRKFMNRTVKVDGEKVAIHSQPLKD